MIARTLLGFVCALAATAAAAQQPAPRPDGAIFENWAVRCQTTPDGTALPCYAFQRAVSTENDGELLHVAVSWLSNDASRPAVRFRVPLGARLKPGLVWVVGNGVEQPLLYDACQADGCYAYHPISPQDLQILRTTAAAELRYLPNRGEPIRLQVPLAGLNDALAAMGR